MKLFQLTLLFRVNLKNLRQSKYLLGATLLILGGFFYYQTVQANQPTIQPTLPQSLISQKNTHQSSENLPNLNNHNKQINQSTVKSKISLKEIEKRLSLPVKNQVNNLEVVNHDLKNKLTDILVGTPMENMIEPISQQDKIIAAFLVGIALKESQLGRHSPKFQGQECYNYWGYRGRSARKGTNGYSCFNSPEEAISVISKRLNTFVFKQHRNTPQKMLIWKCGNSCATHSPASVAKWVADVSIYFNKLNS